MAWVWTKSFSALDDGTALGGLDLGNIQTDIVGNAVDITTTQTITANKTFSGAVAFTGTMVNVPKILASTANVDINTGAKQTIYTCPTGQSCVVIKVIVRNLSVACVANSISFGWDANCTNVIANATYASFTGSTVYTCINAMAGATLGLTTNVFGVYCNTPNTAATATIDVFGYVF